MSPAAFMRLQRWPLANRLAGSMLLVAAVAIALLFYDLNQANLHDIEALQAENLANDARELAHGLDRLVSTERSRVLNLSLARSVQEFAGALPEQRSALFTPTLADFSNFLASNRFYRAIVLLDQQGEVLISTDGNAIGVPFGSSLFFQQARSGNVYMSDPGISLIDRRPVIWLAAPVYARSLSDGNTVLNRRAGVIAVALDPDEIWQYIEQFQVGEQGYAMLVDRYGIRLAHGRDRRYIFRSLVPLPAPVWQALQAEQRFADLSGIADTKSQALSDYIQRNPLPKLQIVQLAPAGERVYVSAAQLSTRDWTVLALVAQREVLAPATSATLRGLSVTVIVVLLLGITVAWMARRLLLPVPQLARAAAKIAQGDLNTPVRVRSSSELTLLAENFEIMRQRLAASRDELAAWASTLEQRVARRSHELSALSEVIAFAARGLSREDLLAVALQQALQVLGAEIGGIWIADSEGRLELAAQLGLSQELEMQLRRFAPHEGLLGQVQAQGEALALDDISRSPRLARAVLREQGLHAFGAVPLRIHGRTLGVMGVFSHAREGFSLEAMRLASAIAQQIALSLDNLLLLAQVEHQARAMAALQERERIAGEIHDGVAQNLSYLYLHTDRLVAELPAQAPEPLRRHLGHSLQVLSSTSSDVRQLIARLHAAEAPPGLLGDGLRSEARRVAGELQLELELQLGAAAELLVSADVSTELARIVGEALRNAHNHGQARLARIELQREHGCATLRIHDDGSGFDPQLPPPVDGRSHFGLSVMRARAARLGGELLVSSRPGAGTCVEVRWPLPG